MNTEQAIKAMEQGHIVREKGWGEDITGIFMQIPSNIPKEVIPKMTSLPDPVKNYFANSDIAAINYHSQIAIIHHGYHITGFHFSTAELMNGEWEIVEHSSH